MESPGRDSQRFSTATSLLRHAQQADADAWRRLTLTQVTELCRSDKDLGAFLGVSLHYI